MAKPEEHEQEPADKPDGNKKKLIIIGTALLVSLACIAAGVAFYMNSTAKDAAHPPETEKSADAVKKKGPPVIYGLEPFVVNIRDNTDIRYLKLKVEFEVVAEGKEVKAELDPYLPKLRDSILMLLTSKSLQDVQDLPGKSRLRQEIMSSASRILPRGKVNQVFFTDFVVQ
jgi:flagellar FliL protein